MKHSFQWRANCRRNRAASLPAGGKILLLGHGRTIANGLRAGRIAMRISLRGRLVVIGIASHLNLPEIPG